MADSRLHALLRGESASPEVQRAASLLAAYHEHRGCVLHKPLDYGLWSGALHMYAVLTGQTPAELHIALNDAERSLADAPAHP